MTGESEVGSNVAFFLGAGASVDAEIPDTKMFVDEFENKGMKSATEAERSAYAWIKKRLKNSRRPLDLELLLEGISRLQQDEYGDDVVNLFSTPRGQLKKYEKAIESLNTMLRDYIRTRMIVPTENTDYLDPLEAFVDEYKPIDVFSVNYDACIELWCDKKSVRYSDGFQLEWDIELFKKDCALRLLKLHGSITWWFSEERRTQFKLPIKADPGTPSLKLISDHGVENLIMYPTEPKLATSLPIADLTHLLRIGLPETQLLIVVGYTFRDPDILSIMIEGAGRNPDLRLLLVSPHAGRVYAETLAGTPLKGRVGVVQRPFREALKDHYLVQIVKRLPTAHGYLNEAKRLERDGNLDGSRNAYLTAATQLAQLGFVFEAREISERFLPKSYMAPLRDKDERLIKFYLNGLVVLLEGLDYESARWWSDKLLSVLDKSIGSSELYRESMIDVALAKKLEGIKPQAGYEESIHNEVSTPSKKDISDVVRNLKPDQLAKIKPSRVMRMKCPKGPQKMDGCWTDGWLEVYLIPIKEAFRERLRVDIDLISENRSPVLRFTHKVSTIERMSSEFNRTGEGFVKSTKRIADEVNQARDLLAKISTGPKPEDMMARRRDRSVLQRDASLARRAVRGGDNDGQRGPAGRHQAFQAGGAPTHRSLRRHAGHRIRLPGGHEHGLLPPYGLGDTVQAPM